MKRIRKENHWCLRMIRSDYWEKRPDVWWADEGEDCIVKYFPKLSDAFNFIGFRLKRDRLGYSAVKDGWEYDCTKF